MPKAAAVVTSLALLAACAHQATVQRVGPDTYRVVCPGQPLGVCLSEAANNACDKRAYFVARGISDVNLRGVSETPDISSSSEAVIVCSPSRSWGERAKELMASPSAAVVAAPSPPPPLVKAPVPVCAPGSTQACVGAAACQGGQACKPDGTGYEACDCGAPAPMPPASPEPSQAESAPGTANGR